MIAHQPASAEVSTNQIKIRRPKIGLALSGGGARGSAHMGVLRTLERAEIGYDLMAATSIGALAGLIHCCGYTADYMIEACKRELMPSWWLTRLIRPGGIAKGIHRYIGHDCRLEELPTPLYITATDLISGELVVQDRGCAVKALMASMSLPGMTSPVAESHRLLVDGGVLNNLPGEVLRDRGADIVIGVDISGQPSVDAPWSFGRRPGMVGTLSRSLQLMSRRRHEEELAACDIVIRPQLSDIGFTAFKEVDRLADAGSLAAEAVLDDIRRLIETKTSSRANDSQNTVATAITGDFCQGEAIGPWPTLEVTLTPPT